MVDPAELEGLDEFTEWLEAILHNPCSVWEEDGEEFLIEIRKNGDRFIFSLILQRLIQEAAQREQLNW